MKIRHINTLLLAAVVTINAYIIALPLLPSLTFWIASRDPERIASLTKKVTTTQTTGKETPSQPSGNRLIIPSMLLDEPVHTGPTARTLRQGLWMRPQGSTPDAASNSVIVGHRFTYTNPRGTLYHLDKVSVGDPIALWWEGKRHTYTVSTIKTVRADATSIEAPTADSQLTLYTCTPLWLPKDRLVVIATEDTP